MRIKLDENLHGDVRDALLARGHDVATVHEERLSGRPDIELATAVKTERRCLTTFDLGFADARRYAPAEYSGIVVLRLRVPTASRQVRRLVTFLSAETELAGRLLVVDETRARDWTS